MKKEKAVETSSLHGYEVEYPLFNFSFMTNEKRYDLRRQENGAVDKILLQKIFHLSQLTMKNIKLLPREKGVENLSETQIKKALLPAVFVDSGRYAECASGYCVFRLGKSGRVFLKRRKELFYVIAVDTHFDLYKH
ncbi:hypothetical protein NFX39_06245 [Fructobacillus sp. W13]|uniref:Uncharacterized protein n=1 Tax=Fructobacillus apis TaxID=2935017 RepID=A0ABT0ZRQ2_9LACO|nr:hypothetical protein [Fructobacillus apis]MCO0832676.1 hypothetical protein [Fructobacillus apis]